MRDKVVYRDDFDHAAGSRSATPVDPVCNAHENGADELVAEAKEETVDYDGTSSGTELDSDSDGDEEPLFKYSRITKLPKTFFHKDAVSAVLVTPSVIVFATHSGVVHLAQPDMTSIRTLRVHRASIVDIDAKCGFVATASIDGTVVICSVHDAQDVYAVNFKRPVHGVALDPNYNTTKAYLSGGTAGAVTLSAKGWLKSRFDTVLYQSSSTIVAVKWIGNNVIWCNDTGISIYSMVSSSVIQRIARLPNSPQSDLYRPRFHLDRDKVYVAWASTIWVIGLEDAKVLSTLRVDWLISGVAPIKEDHLLLLTTEAQKAPELRVIDADGDETYVDELSLEGFSRLAPNDYSLSGDGPFIIVSASDGVLVTERSAFDHIEWLMERGHYLAAYKLGEGTCEPAQRKEIGERAARILIDKHAWAEAAALLSEILALEDKEAWEQWGQIFFEAGEYTVIADHLPDVDAPDLRTKVLLWCLECDHQKLASYISLWRSDSFDAPAVTHAMNPSADAGVQNALARLHLAMGDSANAARTYLNLDDKKAFEIVEHYNLWREFQHELAKLLLTGGSGEESDIIRSQAMKDRIKSLASVKLQIYPSWVIEQLQQENDQLLFLYLQEVMLEDEFMVRDYADMLVDLYAKYAPDQLLSFLVRNESYNLTDAISICERNKLTDELVYLYGQAGQTQKALQLIVGELGDSKRAVEFAKVHDDTTLWNSLIEYSVDKPDFVLQLLRTPQVKAAQVLNTVPLTLKISGLRSALSDVLQEQNADLTLENAALEVAQTEGKGYLTRLQAARQEGYNIDPDANTKLDWSNFIILGPEDALEIRPGDLPEPPIAGKENWFSQKIWRLTYILRNVI